MPRTVAQEIDDLLPNGEHWRRTPHALLEGDTPDERIANGDEKAVRELLASILYVGIS